MARCDSGARALEAFAVPIRANAAAHAELVAISIARDVRARLCTYAAGVADVCTEEEHCVAEPPSVPPGAQEWAYSVWARAFKTRLGEAIRERQEAARAAAVTAIRDYLHRDQGESAELPTRRTRRATAGGAA